jgi:glutamine synthetase adenylyltransferase
LYDTRLVEAICREFQDEQRDSGKTKELMALLQAVVTENKAEMGRRLTCIISDDLTKPRDLGKSN